MLMFNSERLAVSKPNDLKKVGAFFGIYALWASQPASIAQQQVTVDLGRSFSCLFGDAYF